MQTSGMCPSFSDGAKKTIVGKTPPRPARPVAPKSPPKVDKLTPGDRRDTPKGKAKK